MLLRQFLSNTIFSAQCTVVSRLGAHQIDSKSNFVSCTTVSLITATMAPKDVLDLHICIIGAGEKLRLIRETRLTAMFRHGGPCYRSGAGETRFPAH